jgi:hypothetical protein
MKKIILLFAVLLAVTACKNKENNTKEKELITTKNSNLSVYRGEFIYTADGAVLKGKDFLYGVTIDEKMQELADKVASVKYDEFDMVPVVVTGTLSKKPEGVEGWDEILTIVDIVQVSKKPAKADVKIKSENAQNKSVKAIKKEEKK